MLDLLERRVHILEGIAEPSQAWSTRQATIKVLNKLRDLIDSGQAVQELPCGPVEQVTCPDCHGAGCFPPYTFPLGDTPPCATCNGSGRVTAPRKAGA